MYHHFRIKKKYSFIFLILIYIVFCQSCMRMRMSKNNTKTYFKTTNIDFSDKIFVGKDFQIHYIETGSLLKPTLVFVHGSPGSWDAFKSYLKDTMLQKKYRMIAIDRPGFGYSDFGKAENLKTQADKISIFIESIKNDKSVILIGHSMGGPVIVKMATQNPSRYNHLVILSGAVDPDAETPENWRSFIMIKPIRYLIPGALRVSNDELWWLKKDLIQMKNDLKKITSSVTIIHGTKDQLVPYSNVAFMKREFVSTKTTKIIAIPNANHFIPWEHFQTIKNCIFALNLN